MEINYLLQEEKKSGGLNGERERRKQTKCLVTKFSPEGTGWIFTAQMKMKVQMFTLLVRLSNGTADPINFPMQRSYRINISTEGFT